MTEWPTLPCPQCGHRSVVSNAYCLVEVGPGVSGIVYGKPEVLFLTNDEKAQCNSNQCDWRGTVGDVRVAEAARNATP